MRYIILHSVQFNVCTHEVREGLHDINELSVNVHPCDIYGLNEHSDNDLNELSVNGLN